MYESLLGSLSEVESVDLVSEKEDEKGEVVSIPLPYVNLIEGTRAAPKPALSLPFLTG